MRTSRVLRQVIRIFLLFASASLTVVSILGGLSAVTILSNPNNIGLPDGDIEFNFDFADPSNNNVTVPFNFTNDGYFPLTGLNIYLLINMTYDHINYSIPGQNDTRTISIFEIIKPFPSVPAGQTLDNVALFGGPDDFFALPALAVIDTFAPVRFFIADLELIASYSLELLNFRVVLTNITVHTI